MAAITSPPPEREPLIERAGNVLQIIVVAAGAAVAAVAWSAYENANVAKQLADQNERGARQYARQNEQTINALKAQIQYQIDHLTDTQNRVMSRVMSDGFNAEQGRDHTSRIIALEASAAALRLAIIESLIELLEPRQHPVFGEVSPQAMTGKKR